MKNKTLLYLFFTTILCFIAELGVAQPKYFLAQRKGCAPFTVKMIDQSVGSSTPIYRFEPKDSFMVENMHTYINPGKYWVVQAANFLSVLRFNPDTAFITVVDDSLTPVAKFIPCEGRKVTVDVQDQIFDRYFVNWGDGVKDTITQTLTHTYATESNFNIQIQGLYDENGKVVCRGISNLQTPIKPFTKLIKADWESLMVDVVSKTNGKITFKANLNPLLSYKLKIKKSTDISDILLDTIQNAGTGFAYTISNLNTSDFNYCMTLSCFDACGQAITSSEFCTSRLEVASVNNQNQLQFPGTILDSLARMEIWAQNKIIASFNAGSIPSDFTDPSLNCCYEIKNYYGQDLRVSISALICSQGQIGVLSPPNFIRTNFNSQMLLQTTSPSIAGFKTFEWLKSVNGEPFTSLGRSLSPKTDATYNPNTYTCYVAKTIDSCDNSSNTSVSSCMPNLRIQSFGELPISISWPSYTGSYVQIDYELQILDANGLVLQSNPVSMQLKYIDIHPDTINQDIFYRLKITLDNADIVYSAAYPWKQSLKLKVPNAFTPNGDGLNEVFQAKGLFVKKYSMNIYNRWGQILFQSQDLKDGWDGGQASPGIYTYSIEATDGQEVIKKTGTITLIK